MDNNKKEEFMKPAKEAGFKEENWIDINLSHP